MESWEVVRRMVPRGTSHIMARILRVKPDYVRRWRKPTPENNEDGTGFRNPIDRFCDFIEGGFLIDPIEPRLAVEYITNFYRQLVRRHENRGFAGSAERRDACAQLLTASAEAVNSLTIEACTDHTLECLVKLSEAVDRAKEKVQAELHTRNEPNSNVSPIGSVARPSGRA